jgi:hypothetical protein
MSAPLPKITDAMVDAGARVLSELIIDLADGFVSPSEAAEAVFLAMQGAQEAACEAR